MDFTILVNVCYKKPVLEFNLEILTDFHYLLDKNTHINDG